MTKALLRTAIKRFNTSTPSKTEDVFGVFGKVFKVTPALKDRQVKKIVMEADIK